MKALRQSHLDALTGDITPAESEVVTHYLVVLMAIDRMTLVRLNVQAKEPERNLRFADEANAESGSSTVRLSLTAPRVRNE